MNLYDDDVEFEGKTYKAICIDGNTGKQSPDWSDYWGASCHDNYQMNEFLKDGDNIKFKCIGDGKTWRMTLRLYASEFEKASYFIFEFPTKKGKMTEITIPYKKFRFDTSVKRKFDKNEITGVEFFAYNVGQDAKRSIQIFDVRVY